MLCGPRHALFPAWRFWLRSHTLIGFGVRSCFELGRIFHRLRALTHIRLAARLRQRLDCHSGFDKPIGSMFYMRAPALSKPIGSDIPHGTVLCGPRHALLSSVALLAPLAHAHRLRSEAQFELCGLFVIGLSLSRIFDSLFVFGSGSTASRAPTSPSAPCSVFAYGCGSSPAARAAWSAPTRRRARAACPFPASRPAVSGGFRLTAFATYCGAVNAIDSGMFAPVSEL